MSSAPVGEGSKPYKRAARHVGGLHSTSRSPGERWSLVLTGNMGKEKTHINIVVIGHVDSGKFNLLKFLVMDLEGIEALSPGSFPKFVVVVVLDRQGDP